MPDGPAVWLARRLPRPPRVGGRRDESDPREGGDRADHGHAAPGRLASPPTTDLVAYLCTSTRHVTVGAQRPDGAGHTTLHRGQWAYCTAGLGEEPHEWREIAPRHLRDIHHGDVTAGGGIG